MKKPLLSVLFVSAFALQSYSQNYVWTQKAYFTPGNRAGAFAFAIGNKGYVGSGVTQISPTSIAYVSDFWEYDPSLDVWTQMASYPTAVSSPAAFSIGGLGYVTTGFDGVSYLTNTYAYNPATNTWTAKAAFAGAARYTTSCFTIGTYAYVGLGKSGPYHSDFFKYDVLTDTWSSIATIGGSQRQNAKAFAANNMGYVIGGAFGFTGDYFDNWMYDPLTNSWTQKANYPGGGSYAGFAFSLNGLGYIGTGSHTSTSLTYGDCYSYNPATDTWMPEASFGGGVRNSTSYVSIGNKGYAGLGSTGIFPTINYQADWWEFSVPTSINANHNSNTINVYANGYEICVQLQNAAKENYTLRVFDVSGKIISTKLILAGNSLYKTNLNVAKGNYVYELILDKKTIKSGKFLIK